MKNTILFALLFAACSSHLVSKRPVTIAAVADSMHVVYTTVYFDDHDTIRDFSCVVNPDTDSGRTVRVDSLYARQQGWEFAPPDTLRDDTVETRWGARYK